MLEAAALLGAAGGVGAVRLGWQRRRALALVGWAAVVLALVVLTVSAGAWGLAMGSVAAMTAAFVLLAHAAWASPRKAARPVREAPSISLPRGTLKGLARRFAVFLLVVPVAFAAAQWFAYGAQAMARSGGWGEADAIVLTLFVQPVVWTIVAAIQMMRATTAAMIAPPVVAALAGTIMWGLS